MTVPLCDKGQLKGQLKVLNEVKKRVLLLVYSNEHYMENFALGLSYVDLTDMVRTVVDALVEEKFRGACCENL